jgi:hypothetical protein
VTIAPLDLRLLARSNFGAILADPPWRFATWSDKGRDRAPDNKSIEGGHARLYETMSIEEIAALPITALAAKDCVLFLWTTWAHLFHSRLIIERWSFEYKTAAFVWTKADAGQLSMFGDDVDPQMGMGRWTRLSSEPCLLATRGKPKHSTAVSTRASSSRAGNTRASRTACTSASNGWSAAHLSCHGTDTSDQPCLGWKICRMDMVDAGRRNREPTWHTVHRRRARARR